MVAEIPARDLAICPVCGEQCEGGRHPCPGPRVSQPGGFACEIARRPDDVYLPGEAPGA